MTSNDALNFSDTTTLRTLINANLPFLRSFRRDLHRHPELRFEELRTAEVVAAELQNAGYVVRKGMGGTGLVATLQGKQRGPGIVLRADMDALPISEKNVFDHASRCDGRMHACGHDGHTTMLLGAALLMKTLQAPPHDVHFVFQPGEEGGAGARKMMDDGLFQEFPTAAVFGMHNWPALPAGQFGLRVGPIMAAGQRFRISVTGLGAHAAQPHMGIDPIPIACAIVQQFQTLVARHKSPVDPAVISVCMFNAGMTDNVIPDSAELRGTVRTLSSTLLKKLQGEMTRIAEGIAAIHGAGATLEFFQYYPATVNTPAETAFCRQVLERCFGASNVHADVPANMTSEDFGFMLEERPGTYILIGNAAAGSRQQLHNAHYDFNDDIIAGGVEYWVRLAQSFSCEPAQ
ncbi:M20 aminoacylase family protein [Herbaspirillum sp. NPDC101396]|uniref:M20 aminoacylase family protein n=1 Tax=Herbaspirillum sp. NPDC101396 TaxID=3364005 RepID=UPI00383AB3AB